MWKLILINRMVCREWLFWRFNCSLLIKLQLSLVKHSSPLIFYLIPTYIKHSRPLIFYLIPTYIKQPGLQAQAYPPPGNWKKSGSKTFLYHYKLSGQWWPLKNVMWFTNTVIFQLNHKQTNGVKIVIRMLSVIYPFYLHV